MYSCTLNESSHAFVGHTNVTIPIGNIVRLPADAQLRCTVCGSTLQRSVNKIFLDCQPCNKVYSKIIGNNEVPTIE